MTIHDLIYSCPDCDDQDLERDGAFGWYCPGCERTVADAQLTGVTDADLD